MLRSVHHFNVIVADMAKTKHFYHDILGLEIALETVIEDAEFSRGVDLVETKVLATFFQLPDSQTMIEAFEYVSPSDGKPIPPDKKVNDAGWTHLCFQVDDIDATCDWLSKQGVKFSTTPVTIADDHPHVPGVRFCYFRGPDGEVLELLQG